MPGSERRNTDYSLDWVRSASGKKRIETLFECYERHFVIGMRLARLEDWRHNRLADLDLERADYDPEPGDSMLYLGGPASLMTMSLPYVINLDDDQHLARVGRAEEVALHVTCVAGMEKSA